MYAAAGQHSELKNDKALLSLAGASLFKETAFLKHLIKLYLPTSEQYLLPFTSGMEDLLIIRDQAGIDAMNNQLVTDFESAMNGTASIAAASIVAFGGGSGIKST